MKNLKFQKIIYQIKIKMKQKIYNLKNFLLIIINFKLKDLIQLGIIAKLIIIIIKIMLPHAIHNGPQPPD